MTLSFLPLLHVQRELYALPRGMERFREYIRTMVDAENALGYPPQGLTDRAGFALALHEARRIPTGG